MKGCTEPSGSGQVTLSPARCRADVLAFIAGVSLVSAFAPLNWYWMSMVALAVLFACWRDVSGGVGARRGFLFGLGLFGTGAYWFHGALDLLLQQPSWVTILFTGGLFVLLALPIAAVGWIVCAIPRMRRSTRILWWLCVLPSAWILQEWVRTWWFYGFPWLFAGIPQVDNPILQGFLPVVGTFGTGWIVALAAALLAALWTDRGVWSTSTTVGGVALLVAGIVFANLEWTRDSGDSLRVAALYGEMEAGEKFERGVNPVVPYVRGTEALHHEVDLVVWPELAIPREYDREMRGYMEPLSELRIETPIVVGYLERDAATGQMTNMAGELLSGRPLYQKRGMVPIYEFVPLRGLLDHEWLSWLRSWFAVAEYDMQPGPAHQQAVVLSGVRIGTTICYEMARSHLVNRSARDSDVMLNLSEDVWYGHSTAPAQMLQITRTRARETGRPIVRAASNGISALVDHRGRVITQAVQEPGAVGAVQPRQGMTPYLRLGDGPILLLVALLFYASAFFSLLAQRRDCLRAPSDDASADCRSHMKPSPSDRMGSGNERIL